MHDIAEFLATIPPFDTLAAGELEHVAAACEIEFHAAGETILLQASEPPSYVWIVRRGTVELVDDGRVVDHLGEGEMFGHHTMLTGELLGVAVRALEDTLCYRLPESVIRPVLARPAALSYLVHSAGASPELRDGRSGIPERVDPGQRRVGDLVRREAVVCKPGDTVQHAAERMAEAGSSSVLVDLGDTLGIVTDRDLRTRVVAAGAGPDTLLGDVMTAPARTVSADRTAGDVLLEMLDRGVRHFPVLDARRALVGVVNDTDLMAVEARWPFHVRAAVGNAATRDELIAAARQLSPMVIDLHRAGTPAAAVGRVITTVNDAVTRKLIELAEAELGPPPARYTWLALGSYARREAFPGSDYDSAIAWERAADDAAAGAWTQQLAERVISGHAACGIPADEHGATASHRLFRRSIDEWEAAVDSWVTDPSQPKAVILLSVIVDARGVWDAPLAEPRLNAIFTRTRRHPQMLRLLRQLALAHRPPLGFVRGLVVEHDGANRGLLDIKSGGLLPIAGLARAAAMEAGVAAASTAARLNAAEAAGTLPASDVAVLRDAFGLFTDLRMDHQITQLAAGRTPDDHIAPDSLSPLTRTYLKEAFRAVARIQRGIESLMSLER